jgi:hypothetical protein
MRAGPGVSTSAIRSLAWAWTFAARAGQQIRFDLVNVSTTGIRFDLTGPNGTVFQALSSDSELITLSTGGPYVLTAYTPNGELGAYAFRSVDSTPIALAPAVPFQGQLTGSSQYQLFKIDVDKAGPLRFLLDDASPSNHNELYVRLGSQPTRGAFTFGTSGAGADREVVVPLAATGTWYVLAHSESVPTPSAFTLTARVEPMQITSVTPDRVGDQRDVVVTLTGLGFGPSTSVTLNAGGRVYAPRARRWASETGRATPTRKVKEGWIRSCREAPAQSTCN